MAYTAPPATFTFTELQDMIVPQVWQNYIIQESTTLTRFWSSGIISDLTPVLGTLLGGGGTTVNMPFFHDLDFGGAQEEIFDDTTDLSVDKITTGLDVATVIERAKAWGATDLSADLSGQDPLPVIASRFGAFWARQMQKVLLSITAGTMGSLALETANSTNHNQASPNNLDITGATGNAAVFSAESFIDAQHKLGDHADGLTAIAVHSDTLRTMRKEDLIDFIKPSDNGMPIATYAGKVIIVDDGMPVDANGNYTTYLFGAGVFGYAEGNLKVPVEIWREPLKNMGRESIINRRKFAMHLRGVKWVGTPSAGPTVSNADLANPANWQRVYDNKLIRCVAFRHKNY